MFFTLLFGALLIFVIFSILFVAKIFKEKPVFKLLLISFIVIGLVAFLAAMLFSGKVHKLVAFWLCEIGFDWLVFLPFVFLTTLVIFLFSYFKVFSRSFGIKIFYVMSVIAFLLLAYGRYTFYNINYKMYNLSFLDTVAKSENAKCGSMKIVAVSDLHLGNYINRDNLKRFVDSINASNPQIVLFVGDIIDNELFPLIRQQMEKEFIKLKAPLGKYIVFGNHESYGSSSKEDVADYYRQCGLTVLRDSAVLVDSLFYLVGRDDKGHGKSVRKSTDYIIKKSIKDYNNNIPIIVLDHCPATFKEWNNREHIEYKPFLVLSGHTHNGQIFPFNKIVKNMYPHYYGQFFEDGVNYITTSGLGQWGPKFRLGTNSEIVVINLLYNRPNAHINAISTSTQITDKFIKIPQRKILACSGSEFIKQIDTVSFEMREKMIVQEILSGNIPDFIRKFHSFSYTISNITVEFFALPDYLAIGSCEDFVRIPMGPLAAQEIADSLFCSLPTSFLVDKIAEASYGAIEPFPFRPFGERNTFPVVFEDSNNAINALYKAKGYIPGQLISGLKKDVIITAKITDPVRLNHVTIYGWHYPNGRHIQPSNNIHINRYVDYSHGIRLIYRKIKINGIEHDIKDILVNPNLYMLLSNEQVPMKKATYAGDVLHSR